MDDATRLHHRPDAANPKPKRPCLSPNLNPELNLNPVDGLLESLLEHSDSFSAGIDVALDRVVESKLYDEDKGDVIERAFRLSDALAEAAKRSERRLAAAHNAAVWALPNDLTIKVFSFLDTGSVFNAAAACSFFLKCSANPLCFSNIDLTTATSKVNNAVASIMIRRAGKDLRSLKLGSATCSCPPSASRGSQHLVCSPGNTLERADSEISSSDRRFRQGKDRIMLTRSCLSPLVENGGASGALLKRLCLYKINGLDDAALRAALSACPGLVDLEIVGLHVELRQTLESVCKCPLIERLFFVATKTAKDDCLKLPTCADLANNCPRLSSLALRGFLLHDIRVRALFKGLPKLKSVDFSTSYALTGEFLRNLGASGAGSSLECLNLRDCVHLRAEEVSRFLSSMLAGRCAKLMRIDVSNREGLAPDRDWYRRCYAPTFLSLRELTDERPGLRFIADFPAEEGFLEEEETLGDSDQSSSDDEYEESGSDYEYEESGSDDEYVEKAIVEYGIQPLD